MELLGAELLISVLVELCEDLLDSFPELLEPVYLASFVQVAFVRFRRGSLCPRPAESWIISRHIYNFLINELH